MSGFPARTSHEALGGNREDAMRVTNPKKQVGAPVFNAIQWQVAGMNRVCPLVTLTVDSDGTRLSGAEAWNDQDEVGKRVTVATDATGQYVITAAATYPDENGVEQPVEFHGAIITPIGSSPMGTPSYTLNSPRQITVYQFDADGDPVAAGFTIDIK